MPDGPAPPGTAGKAVTFLLFLVKLAALLAGVFAFGLAIFWLRKSLG
ncbi:MAG: hypothetical protein JWQ16_2931 [Novosphingobium sp.]|nr:hypothetical protein [Novosphingobium sp.]